MKDIKGKVAVLTGGAGGIGKGIARALLDEGAKVVLADIDKTAIDAAVEELSSCGEVSGVPTDVTSYESVDALADAVYRTHGACHLLFNNAGVGGGGGRPWEQESNDWRWTFSVNVFGVAHGCIAFIPRMLASGEHGHVTNTSSGNGGFAPIAWASVYAASKAAVTSYTESVAAALRAEEAKLKASIFYPSGGLLETGIWDTTERTRPAELPRTRPTDPSQVMTLEQIKESIRAAGVEPKVMDLDELGRFVVQGVRQERFIIGYGIEEAAQDLAQRAEAIGRCELPVSLSLG